jgi:hypothetical protein
MKNVYLVVLLFASFVANAQNVPKKVSLAKGQQYEQVSLVNMNISQEMMGQVMEMKMESTTNNVVEVKEASNNSYLVANTMKRMQMNMTGVQEVKFDSDKKEDMDSQMGEALKDKIGKTSELVLNSQGIITEVKNKPAKDDAAVAGGMMGNMLGQDGSEEKEGANFSALANLPVKGAKVGESWTDSVVDKDIKVFTTYTLKEIKGKDGVVSMSGNMNVNRDMEQQGMTLQISMQGTILGEYIFDVATGIIKSKKANTKATGTVEAMGQSIPMTIDTTVTSIISKKS